ncbi:Cupredoxin [Glarea lozoyensis ATCC 20868]|uniref:Cupredoxin n=1 Tax=Glarea lozoyensis (strain ATCC 20868 / MF5171) TaxID=1116229 RepID=S3DW91_GLAL2|nr:Cupredoxin [Glarea lozoyensis ATCC 20868]EPE36211.1 Cupredoxin [Glarea lozoyensis ATCC 20868]
MAVAKETPYDSSSDDVEDMEMQERSDSQDETQNQRLLPGDDAEAMDGVDYKVEWHLRTVWVVALSVCAAVFAFAILVAFTRTFIVEGNLGQQPVDFVSVGGFRRPPADYILDPAWNFEAPAQVRTYNWVVTDIVGNPDGVFRPMLTINGQFPGPLIECNEGDTIIVEVDNQSINSTAIHFHGLYQNGTNWMDGATGVTQCPIAPRRTFRYEFTVSGQSGTYYYHSHQAVTASDGLFGPLVIHARNEKELQQISYASDRVVMLQDYYHDVSSKLLESALEPGSESPPIPDGALINGLNQQDCSKLPGRLCDNTTCTQPRMDLLADAHHRLRIINVGALAWFQVSVDEHEFSITEVDGTDIIPTKDRRLMVSPAQRYSIMLNTGQNTADNFWFRARMVTHCWQEPDLPGPGFDEVKAAIHYTSKRRGKAAVSRPSTRRWSAGMEVECRDMNISSFIPVESNPTPVFADHSYYLRSNLEIGDWRLQRGFFNSSTFRPNLQQPTLHRSVEGLSSRNESFTTSSGINGPNTLAYDIKNDFLIQHNGIQVVDLIIQNFDEGNHPMHLHGHKFWVLGQGHGMFPGYEGLKLASEGKGLLPGQEGALDTRIRRDVASTEGFGWLAIRFVADNPGVWAFHCHMAWHSEAGLSMQFLSRVEDVAQWSIPEANLDLCAADIEELRKGAAPLDSKWWGFGIGD